MINIAVDSCCPMSVESSGRPRLLIATDWMLPRIDGISRFLAAVLPSICEDYAITIIAPDFGPAPSLPAGCNMIRFPVSRIMRFKGYAATLTDAAVVHQQVRQADAVWVQGTGPIGRSAARESVRQDKRLFATLHAKEWEIVARVLFRQEALVNGAGSMLRPVVLRTYDKASMVMVPHESMVTLVRKAGFLGPALEVVPLGIDTARFIPSADRAMAKRAVGLPDDKVVIGYVGRLTPEKNLALLERAYRRLLATSVAGRVQLLLVGSGSSAVTARLSRIPRCKVAGPVPDVVAYLQAIDIFVHPSFSESTSLSLLEAMSCGAAPVCTDVSVTSRSVVPGVNGHHIDPHDNAGLAKILAGLVLDPVCLSALQRRARATALVQGSWDASVPALRAALARGMNL